MPTSGSTASSTVSSPSSAMTATPPPVPASLFFRVEDGDPALLGPRFLFSRSPESLRTLIKRPTPDSFDGGCDRGRRLEPTDGW